MFAERMIIETDPTGKPTCLPELPRNSKMEAIFLLLEEPLTPTINAVELSAKSPSPSGESEARGAKPVGVRGVEPVATHLFDRPHPNPPPLGESLRGGRTVLLNSTALTPTIRQPSPAIAGKGKILGDIVSPIIPETDWDVQR